MIPKIKLRTLTTTDNVLLQAALTGAKTARQMEMVVALLQRYGASKLPDLFPRQVLPFTTELKAVLSGRAPDPHDSILDPTMMEIR